MKNSVPTFQWKTAPKTGYQINTVAMSDDGHTLVTGTSQEYVSADDYAVYCYNTTDGSSAQLLWSDPLGQTSNQGVFWVAASGNGEYVAAGGRYSSTSGFVRAYSVSGGVSSRFEYQTASRVNQVSLSYDGTTLLAVDTDNIYLFTLISGQYQLTSQIKLDAYVDTCDISQDGQWIVAGSGVYSDSSDTAGRCKHHTSSSSSDQTGVIYLCQNINGTLTQLAQWQTASEVLRTVITRDGRYFAASTKTGEVTLYYRDDQSATKRWSYTPDDYLVNLTYGLAITETSSGDVYVGVGSNHGANPTVIDYGYAYLLKNIMAPEGYNATRLWIQQLAYCPNPGMNMDAEATYLTAAVGQPIFSETGNDGAPKETPGVFYLFNNQTGDTAFTYDTTVMSWPMTINSTATACFAGSDDGYIYYWGLPTVNDK